MSLEVADCFKLPLFVVGCCRSTISISMTSEMDLQDLISSEAYRVFAVSDSGLCCNGPYRHLIGPVAILGSRNEQNRFLCSIACGSCLLGYKVTTSTSDSKIAEVIRSVCDLWPLIGPLLFPGPPSSFVNKIWSTGFPPTRPLRSGNISPCRAARSNRMSRAGVHLENRILRGWTLQVSHPGRHRTI